MNVTEFRMEGWHSVNARELPPRDETVEFARDENVYRQPSWFGKWCDLPLEFNVAGLWWREV